MFDSNIIMQICALLGLLAVGIIVAITFIFNDDWMEEIEHPWLVRGLFIVIFLGLLRGAF